MRNREESNNYSYYQNQHQKYGLDNLNSNPDWQFQKVQSILEVAKQSEPHSYQKNNFIDKNSEYNFYTKHTSLSKQQQRQARNFHDLRAFNEAQKIVRNNQKNPFSRSNIETGAVSENQSMEFNSSQQPSFYSKQQFTVLQDFNIDNVSPVKKNICNLQNLRSHENKISGLKQQIRGSKNQALNRNTVDWRTASFAPANKTKMSGKLVKLSELVQELKFMKEGLQSKLKQQKLFITNQLQQIKKFLFKLNIKYEKQLLEFSKSQNNDKNQRTYQRDKLAMLKQSSVKSDDSLKQNQLNQLKKYCQKLEEEKLKSEQKYQKTLKIYQQQIESISHQFQRRMSQQSSGPHFGTESTIGTKCPQCFNLQTVLRQTKSLASAQIQIWKTRLQQQQQKHQKSMKKLQQKVYSLQDQFQFLQKNKLQIQKQLKTKERQILHRQSQLQYQAKDIQKREREIEMREKFLQKEKFQIERKKEKITDYELKLLKEDRRNQNQFKQKQMLSSQYFNNCEKRSILVKNNRPPLERSDSRSSRSSKIDINSRLRQIQMMRTSGARTVNDNGTSRNSSTDSRLSGNRQILSPRVSSNQNIKDYGAYSTLTANKKQHGRQSNQMIKLSQKLSNLTQTIEKQLREIN